MAKKGGSTHEFIDHPLAVTYALALLLALSILALVAVTLNCTSRTVLIDAATGEIISEDSQTIFDNGYAG